MLSSIVQVLTLPINAVVVVLLLPVLLIGQLLSGLSVLAGVPSLIQSGDLKTAFEFIRSDNMPEERRQSLLATSFPNSIAVRS